MKTPEIAWSVWDKSPQVKWQWQDQAVSITFAYPPLSVIPLPTHRFVAIAADQREFGATNLFLYDFEGILCKSFRAPDLGNQPQFGSAEEIDRGKAIQAVIGFFKDGHWQEMASILDIQSGAMSGLHRAY
jgi:hypothetical protein